MNERIYLNGAFVTPEAATISAFDRGFLFGDSVYEVLVAYDGHWFTEAEHYARLKHSLSSLGIANPFPSTDAWQQWLAECVLDAPYQSLYLQITRGTEYPRQHRIPANLPPTVFAHARRLSRLSDTTRQEGIAVCTQKDFRWGRCDIKATTLLANILALQAATLIDPNATEVLLCREGHIVEGSSSAVLVLKNQTVYVPPLSPALLGSITRSVALSCCQAIGLTVEETPYPVDAIGEADAIWIANTTKELLPVCRVNDAIALPAAHPHFLALWSAFKERTQSHALSKSLNRTL